MQLLLWIYLLVTTVVLVNLLIAQMSETYERSLAQGRQEWYFQRAAVVLEYKDTLGKSVPPPFNLVHLLLRGVFAICAQFLSFMPRAGCRGRATAEPSHSFSVLHGLKFHPSLSVQEALQRGSFEALRRCIAAQEAEREGQQMNLLRSLHKQLEIIDTRAQTRDEWLRIRLEKLEAQQEQENGQYEQEHRTRVLPD